MTETRLPPELFKLRIDPEAPLVIVDVDEVLGLFMRGFEAFVVGRGLEMRIDKFALFQNIYRPGEVEHLDLGSGKQLFDEYFEHHAGDMDVVPGATEALAQLAPRASIVILTNAPAQGRVGRAKWLIRHGLPYSLVVNTGAKGPAVAALSARTRGPAAFIDDLLPNLDSAAEKAPAVARFQTVADERLRPLAYSAPDRHRRIDAWPELGEAVADILRLRKR